MKLKFSPELQDYFPAEIEINAPTPLDALSLICVQHPLLGKIEPIPIRVLESSDIQILNDTTLQDKVFTIIPAGTDIIKKSYIGAGGGGGESRSWMTVVVGIALIALSFTTPIGLIGAKFATFLFSAGVSIALQGLIGLLAPQPTEEENKRSRIFSGDKTTTEIGTPVQFILGEIRAYPQLLSFNINARNFDGIDRPDTSPYFKGKSDANLPTANVNKFYGYVRAGDTTKIKQDDNFQFRTGVDF